jgi:hypothetical protein
LGDKISFMKKILIISVGMVVVIGGLAAAYWWLSRHADTSPRSPQMEEFIRNPQAHPDWTVQAGARCPQAPFAFPTSGFIGYLWGDTFDASHPHQGIDIFGGQGVGIVPVYAAAAGYLSRLADWKSSLIVRIPSDPLQPGRQIWTYYTHMADLDGKSLISDAFPPGTSEVFIEAGTFLGYQGNFSGTPGQPVGVHLHFSIVQDDGRGGFRNELDIQNTLDPTPYLGLNLNAATADLLPPVCH